MIDRFVERRLVAAWIFAGSICCSTAALAGAFAEPPVLASSHGLLDLLVIAQPQPVPSISFTSPGGSTLHPTGWVYQVCPRQAAIDNNQCPSNSVTVSSYGGIRLALQKGDTLKIRLVNRLPALDPIKVTHSVDPGGANLPLNLTNLHTHGLVVQARAPTLADPTFGDDIFVAIYNSANGTPVPQTTHQHGSIVKDYVDYRIDIPRNHPSGAFWFHPHVHGIALNQLSSGLSGIISIGEVGDYARGDLFETPFPEDKVRHLILKDLQVLAAGNIQFVGGPANVTDGEVHNQEDPAFCQQFPASPAEVRHGSCPGAQNTPTFGNNYAGGQWYFTVSGEQYPTIRVTEADGEIWRLTNASGSASYDLQLVDDATQLRMVTQLVSVDGVSVDLPPATALDTMVELGGGRFKIVQCPAESSGKLASAPICVSQFAMMPSSRVELWVTYRDAHDHVAPPPRGATATFRTIGITTGAAGDSWPAVDLAKVEFDQPATRNLTAVALDIRGDALAANMPTGIFNAPVPYARTAPLPVNCKPLAAGHRRRIFFGLSDPNNNAASFGLGYEEIDQNGAVVSGSPIPVTGFDPSNNTICLPLGPGQIPVHETWELVNLATENHNFHIHQTKFRVVPLSAPQALLFSSPHGGAAGAGIMEDNVPLPVSVPNTPVVASNQNGYCTIDQWHSGACTSAPIITDIPFSQLGEFVFHCHILEHEDGGMMAKIQVVPSPF